MKIPRPPHNWKVSVQQAIAVQHELRTKVEERRPPTAPKLIAGVDAAFSWDNKFCIGGVVLWDLERKEIVEQHVAFRKILFPYIPGLLTFREAPAIIAALRKLRVVPDVLLCDGQGKAHPRRLGIATHLGLLVNLPAVGCAKSRLIGSYEVPGELKGEYTVLTDSEEVIGVVLRTRNHVKPVFVSIGHLIDLKSATQLVLGCSIKYRLPEPVRLADQLVSLAKK